MINPTQTHSFNCAFASKYGVNEAIMIQNFAFWIQQNRANGKHFYEGRTWTYNSTAAFEKLFPYWTNHQIRRVLESLEKQGVLITGNHNPNGYDRTKWYAFSDECIFLDGQIELAKTPNPFANSAKCITDNKPDINTDTKTDGLPLFQNQGNSGSSIEEKQSAGQKKIQTPSPLSARNQLPTTEGYGEWKPLVDRWVAYKRAEFKKAYKSQETLDIFLEKLKKDSGGSLQTATAMIENSMANSYQGVFPLKNQNTPQPPAELFKVKW